jgi:hypothetical protein
VRPSVVWVTATLLPSLPLEWGRWHGREGGRERICGRSNDRQGELAAARRPIKGQIILYVLINYPLLIQPTLLIRLEQNALDAEISGLLIGASGEPGLVWTEGETAHRIANIAGRITASLHQIGVLGLERKDLPLLQIHIEHFDMLAEVIFFQQHHKKDFLDLLVDAKTNKLIAKFRAAPLYLRLDHVNICQWYVNMK